MSDTKVTSHLPPLEIESVLQAERAAKAGTWDWDMCSGVISWSPAFYELFGLDPLNTQANFDAWRNTLHPDDRESAEARFAQAIEKHTPLFNQYRIVLPDAQVRWIDAYGDMTYDDSGTPVRMSGICIDATERITLALDRATLEHRLAELRRVEQQLRESENRLELALAASGVGLWDYQISSGHATYDPRWCAILGYTQDQLEPSIKSWQRLVHPDDVAQVDRETKAHLLGDTPTHQSEHRLRHKDGHWVWVLSSGKIVERDLQGNPLRLVGTMLDISNQKRITQEGITLLQRFEALLKEAAKPPSTYAVPGDSDNALETLSRRQKQILVMIANGLTSQQIADKLCLAKDTVATHRRELLRKLNLHNAADLARYAAEHGLTSAKGSV